MYMHIYIYIHIYINAIDIKVTDAIKYLMFLTHCVQYIRDPSIKFPATDESHRKVNPITALL